MRNEVDWPYVIRVLVIVWCLVTCLVYGYLGEIDKAILTILVGIFFKLKIFKAGE